jgi:hypothetical protein
MAIPVRSEPGGTQERKTCRRFSEVRFHCNVVLGHFELSSPISELTLPTLKHPAGCDRLRMGHRLHRHRDNAYCRNALSGGTFSGTPSFDPL